MAKNPTDGLGLNTMAKHRLKLIASLENLRQSRYLTRKISFKGRLTSALVFVFEDQPYSYINHCMHMQRPLDCEQDAIFDNGGRYLRCSMHGFIFDPKTGECQSPVCLGQRLQTLRLHEMDGDIYFAEKHLTLID